MMRSFFTAAIFVLLICGSDCAVVSKETKKTETKLNKKQADASLERALEQLGSFLDKLQKVCNAVLLTKIKGEQNYGKLNDFLPHYKVAWMNNWNALSKTIDGIITNMNASTAGKMDLTNVGKIAAARLFIEKMSETFFAGKESKDAGIPAELDRQSALVQPKISSISSKLSDKKMTVAVKKTLQNVLELLKLMFDVARGAQVDMYSLERITSPHKPRRFSYAGYLGFLGKWNELDVQTDVLGRPEGEPPSWIK